MSLASLLRPGCGGLHCSARFLADVALRPAAVPLRPASCSAARREPSLAIATFVDAEREASPTVLVPLPSARAAPRRPQRRRSRAPRRCLRSSSARPLRDAVDSVSEGCFVFSRSDDSRCAVSKLMQDQELLALHCFLFSPEVSNLGLKFYPL